MSAETLATMSPAGRAFVIEDLRRLLRNLYAEHGLALTEDLPLSKKTTASLGRLQCALVDFSCTTASYRAIEKAAFEAVPAEEADELRRRLDHFAYLRDLLPAYASGAEEALPLVLKEIERKLDEKEAAAE